jgi:hypothetical protein
MNPLAKYILDNPYHGYPKPLRRADDFEPLKLLAVTERLRAWSSVSEDATLEQVQQDVKWLLDSHLLYHQENERLYRASLYSKEGDISWRERAEELEERLREIVVDNDEQAV